MAYQPLSPPETNAVTQWVADELRRVGQEFETDKTFVLMTPLYADPDRIYAGMVVLFDASAPSATSGEGLYRRNIANTAWAYLG